MSVNKLPNRKGTYCNFFATLSHRSESPSPGMTHLIKDPCLAIEKAVSFLMVRSIGKIIKLVCSLAYDEFVK